MEAVTLVWQQPKPKGRRQRPDRSWLDYDALEAAQWSDDDGWRKSAACLPYPTQMFWPERGQNKALARAIAVCEGCPVRTECLAAGLKENDHDGGIWGGVSTQGRRKIRRELRARRTAA